MTLNFYFNIYLVGCVVSIMVIISKVLVFKILLWLTKENIIIHNIKKISPPDEFGILGKAVSQALMYLLETALSWLSVFLNVLHTIYVVLNFIRESMVSVPEDVKQLRFPLKNNPNLSAESVWAYKTALEIKAGEIPVKGEGLLKLFGFIDVYCPSFSRKTALNTLRKCDVIEEEIIESAFSIILEREKWHEDWKELNDESD